MPTYQSELAAVSPISEPALPTKSKYDLDQEYKRNNQLAKYEKAIRLLNDDNHQMMEYKHDLVDALNSDDRVKNQLKEGDYTTITEYKALNIPYRKAA